MIRRRALALFAMVSGGARAQPVTVGPGATLAAAVAAARPGDTLLLRAGTYVNDVAEIRKPLTIRATGGIARLVATVPPPNGKAILVTGADVTLEGLDFVGATSTNLNGAGIRYEGGHLDIRRCRFSGNQMNLLAAPDPNGSITITATEFGPTVPTASLSHGLYVNQVGTLMLRDSRFHGAASGHQVKSRAYRTVITNCWIADDDGFGAYSVDLPNGGDCTLSGNFIEQGPNTRNPAILHFGGEGEPHPVSSLRVTGNTVINRLPAREARLLRNQTETTATLTGNRLFGLTPDQVANGPAAVSGVVFLRTPPAPPIWRGIAG